MTTMMHEESTWEAPEAIAFVPETDAEERLLRRLIEAETPGLQRAVVLDGDADETVEMSVTIGEHEGGGWYGITYMEQTNDPLMALRGQIIKGRARVCDGAVWYEMDGRSNNMLPTLSLYRHGVV